MAAQRCSPSKLVQIDARRIPFRSYFDVIGIFDVVKHIEDDTTVLAQIDKALVPEGVDYSAATSVVVEPG